MGSKKGTNIWPPGTDSTYDVNGCIFDPKSTAYPKYYSRFIHHNKLYYLLFDRTYQMNGLLKYIDLP